MNAPFKIEKVLADAAVGITDLKRNPAAVIDEARSRQVAILNRNKPVAYIISPEVWEHLMDLLDEQELEDKVKSRLQNPGKLVEVSIDDL
jgi:antitoxin StbD